MLEVKQNGELVSSDGKVAHHLSDVGVDKFGDNRFQKITDGIKPRITRIFTNKKRIAEDGIKIFVFIKNSSSFVAFVVKNSKRELRKTISGPASGTGLPPGCRWRGC